MITINSVCLRKICFYLYYACKLSYTCLFSSDCLVKEHICVTGDCMVPQMALDIRCHYEEDPTSQVVTSRVPRSWMLSLMSFNVITERPQPDMWYQHWCQKAELLNTDIANCCQKKWTYCTRNRGRGLWQLKGHLNSNRRYLKMEEINKCVAFV